jgi:membrane protein YdbS with pleckstrin-like domain
MITPYSPRPRLPGCGTILLLLAVVAASVWVVVHAVTMWITGHPGAVAVILVTAAAGGALGGWVGARYDARQQRRRGH